MHYDPSNELIYQENKSKLIYLMARLKKAISIWDAFIRNIQLGKSSHLYLGILFI